MGSLITAAGAVASGEQSGFPAVNAIDGDTTTTRWANGGAGPPAWIYVDLGAVYTVDRVVIVWEFASASTYKIQRATTVGTWTDMATYTVGGNDRTDDTNTLGSFTTGDGRYIRVLSSAHSTGFGLSAYEVSVYGTLAPVDIDVDVTTRTLALTRGHTDVWISPFDLTVGQWSQLLAAGDDGSGTAMFGQHLLVDKDDQNVIYAALIANPDGGANTGIYRSTNAGASWQQISGLALGGPDQPVTMAQNVAGDLFVADGVRGTRMGLWVRRKATGVWENPGNFNSVTPVSDCYSVHSNPNNRDDLLVSYHSPWGGSYTAAGALRSTDGGDTWTKIDPPTGLTSGGSNFITHLHAPGGGTGHANRFVYANEADGKWITNNAGADGWTKVSTAGMAHGGSQIVYAPNGDLYMAGSVVQRSTDNGATWTTVSESGVFSFLALATDGTKLYTQVHNGGSFVRQATLPATTTGWSDLGTSRNGGAFVLLFDAPTGRLYANVSVTADYGVWAYQFTPPLPAFTVAAQQPGLAAAATASAVPNVTGTIGATLSGLTAAATAAAVPLLGSRIGRSPLAGSRFTQLPAVLPIGTSFAALRDRQTRAIVTDQTLGLLDTVAVTATMSGLALSASATHTASGATSTIAAALPGLTVGASVLETIQATVAAALSGLTSSASATEALLATVTALQPGLVAAGSAAESYSTTIAAAQSGLTGAASANEAVAATIAALQPGLSGSASATEALFSSLAALQSGLTVSGASSESNPTAIAAQAASLVAAGTAGEQISSTTAALLSGLGASLTAAEQIDSTIAGTLAGLSAAGSIAEQLQTAIAISLAGLSGTSSVAESLSAVAAAQLSGLQAASVATVGTGTFFSLGAQLAGLTATGSLDHAPPAITVTVAAQIPGLGAAGSIAEAYVVIVAAAAPGLQADAIANAQLQIAASLSAQFADLTASGMLLEQPIDVDAVLSAAMPGLAITATIVNGRVFTRAPATRTFALPADAPRAATIGAQQSRTTLA